MVIDLWRKSNKHTWRGYVFERNTLRRRMCWVATDLLRMIWKFKSTGYSFFFFRKMCLRWRWCSHVYWFGKKMYKLIDVFVIFGFRLPLLTYFARKVIFYWKQIFRVHLSNFSPPQDVLHLVMLVFEENADIKMRIGLPGYFHLSDFAHMLHALSYIHFQWLPHSLVPQLP